MRKYRIVEKTRRWGKFAITSYTVERRFLFFFWETFKPYGNTDYIFSSIDDAQDLINQVTPTEKPVVARKVVR